MGLSTPSEAAAITRPTAMVVKVVDASALAARLFGEPEAAFVAERLGGARLVAPSLLGFERANICPTKSRRHPDHRATLALAAVTGLTGYDAS